MPLLPLFRSVFTKGVGIGSEVRGEDLTGKLRAAHRRSQVSWATLWMPSPPNLMGSDA